MNKQEFLNSLREGLNCLPKEDVEERITFYNEMIEDLVEDGMTEEQATAEIGSVDDIVSQVIEETPITKLVRERVRPKRRLNALEIILLVLGSPIWLSLLIAAFAVLLSVYVVIWALIISLWAVEISLIAAAVGGLISGVALIFSGEAYKGMLTIGAAIVCAGLAVFLFYGCKAATKGAVTLTKNIAKWVKSLFIRKENKNE